jgi:predicted ATPase/class 3 adenylate cyclase
MPVRRTDTVQPGARTNALSFLFSDIEGSTRRWEVHREAMEEALLLHDALLRDAVDGCGGRVFKTVGDAFCAVFSSAPDAVLGALSAQLAITHEDWSALGGLHVRMAIHTGAAKERDGDYFGPTLNRVARLVAIGHGGQILISATSAALVLGQLPAGTSLRDLGSHALRGLEDPERVYQLVADDLPVDFPPLRSPELLRGNLPPQLTSFIGREPQVAEIAALLAKARLVTIVGAGGIGKTRTALEVAAELADAYSDGTRFVDLAPITQSNLVASALASVCDVRDIGGSRPLIEEVTLTLRDRAALLIFDNCEQVIAAAAEAVSRILRRCPRIAIVATSREPLGIDGEETYRMPPLAVPPNSEGITAEEASRYEAVALFVSRAMSAQKTFALTDANAPFVSDIVRRLDGIALAIELAAPRVRAFSARDLAKHLDERFALLTSVNRIALPRHKTLHALIEWSYNLLNDAEQKVFRWLSIFRGSFSLDAAKAVCTDDEGDPAEVLLLMSGLVEKSLVLTEPRNEEQRYRMLETTRQYAFECLSRLHEVNDAASRHCLYFVAAAERASDEAYDISSDLWVARHRADLENYRAAIDWGLSQGNDPRAGAAIVAGLRRFWRESFPTEGRALLARAMTAVNAEAAPLLRGCLVLAVTRLDAYGNRTVEAEAEDLAQAAAVFADAGDRVRQIDALTLLAYSLASSGKITEAFAQFDEAIALARSVPNPRLVAFVHIATSTWLSDLGNRERAKSVLTEAMAIYRRDGDRQGVARALLLMAEICFAEGDVFGAIENAREAIAIIRELNDERDLIPILHNAAAYLLAAGDVNEAARCAQECLALAIRREWFLLQTYAMEDLAHVNARYGDLGRAARLVGHTSAIYARQATPRGFTEQFGYNRTMSILEAALSEGQLASFIADGAVLDQTTAVAEAMMTSRTAK